MKVALVAPNWGNSWIPLIKAEVESRGYQFEMTAPQSVKNFSADIYLHAWADSPVLAGGKNVMFLRRYELFNGALGKIDWSNVQDLILVNSWIKDRVDEYFQRKGITTRTHLIYNAVDTSQWTFKDRKPNNKIGMACHVHPKKNLPLALEVLSHLPEDFELHIAGEIQDSCTAEYLNHMGKLLHRKVYLYGHIPREHLDLWWEQFGFCLSTSISEGNPNNVLEAMAKGIMPVILNWPGADVQFPKGYVQDSAQGLASVIQNSHERQDLFPYFSKDYRQHVEQHFSLDNICQAVDIALNQPQEQA